MRYEDNKYLYFTTRLVPRKEVTPLVYCVLCRGSYSLLDDNKITSTFSSASSLSVVIVIVITYSPTIIHK
jgi:hypothetical protein